MKKRPKMPSLYELNSDTEAFVEIMNTKLDYLNKFLLEYMKKWPEERSSVDESIFIYEFAEPFEDYKESLEVCVETVRVSIEKTGVDRGEAKRQALDKPLGLMFKKYKRVYQKLPKKYRLRSGRKGLKALIKDAEAWKHLYKTD